MSVDPPAAIAFKQTQDAGALGLGAVAMEARNADDLGDRIAENLSINQVLTKAAPPLTNRKKGEANTMGGYMIAESNSNIAWHRVQLKKNRDALKALETARFTMGEIAGSTGETKKNVASLKRKIAESERCIAAYEKRTKRPLATDRQSLASVSWSSWNARAAGGR